MVIVMAVWQTERKEKDQHSSCFSKMTAVVQKHYHVRIIPKVNIRTHTCRLTSGDNRLKDSLWGRSLLVTVNLTTPDL